MKEEMPIPELLADAFDLLDAIKIIFEHKHIENLKALAVVLDNRIIDLEKRNKLRGKGNETSKITNYK